MLTASIPEPEGDHQLLLEDVLVALEQDAMIDSYQADRIRFVESETGVGASRHPLVVIADQNMSSGTTPAIPLDLERLTRWLANRVGIEYLRIDPLKIDVAAVTGVLKHSYATRFGILPVAVSGKQITVATSEPFVREWERELGRTLGLAFERVIANPIAVERYLAEFYALSKSISGAQSERAAAGISTSGNWEQLVELGSTTEPDANDAHVVNIVDWILQYAFEQRASDIHLEPRRDEGNIRFRIDGVLHLVNQVPTPVLNAATSRLKALGRLDVIERRRPQDGRIKTKSPGGKEVEMRLSTMPTAFGEKLVMRIFDPDVLVKSFSELGFTRHDRSCWSRMVEQPNGIAIVTGPTGSGKTTTLYSALKRLARPEFNICTIEDPIELIDPDFNQMNVHHNIGLDFASGVRTLLRQDPDIIMVGEIRDAETADTAVQAALTGHLVLTTIHTNDAPSTITRLLELGVAPYLIRAALLGVAAQRLVRTLCPNCKTPVPVDEDEWNALVAPSKVKPPAQTYAAAGCDECRHTGYRGRVGVYEMMVASDAVRTEILAECDVARIRKIAIEEGMRPLRLSGAQKVQSGLTTAAEIFNVVQDVDRPN